MQGRGLASKVMLGSTERRSCEVSGRKLELVLECDGVPVLPHSCARTWMAGVHNQRSLYVKNLHPFSMIALVLCFGFVLLLFFFFFSLPLPFSQTPLALLVYT